MSNPDSKAIGSLLANNKSMIDECDPGMITVAKQYGLTLLLGETEKADNGFFSKLYVVTGDIDKWGNYLSMVQHQASKADVKFNCTMEEVKYEH